MSIQLSIYWQAPDQLQWYWADDTDVYSGTLEELLDQKQEKNTDVCLTRLFLPSQWFTTLDIQLPASVRNAHASVLKFAAEEHLAQDIDSVHLVLKSKAKDGKATIIVTEVERFRTVVQTLKARGLAIMEAYDAQSFSIDDEFTEDVLIQLSNETVSLYFEDRIFNIHYRGFTQWFELWLEKQGLEENEDLTVRLITDSAEGIGRTLSTELGAAGVSVQWVVQPSKQLTDWHEKANDKKHPGNLMTGEFSQGSGDKHFSLWLPGLVASIVALVFWSVVSIFQIHSLNKKTEQTWQASENVFLQVFGQSKRIQRPLMVREMRSQASSANADSGSGVNALTVLNDLNGSAASLIMEDFRFNSSRDEVNFTLIQPTAVEGDAYTSFESLKEQLIAKNYQVEYSANQDSDSYRARYKATAGGQ
ncbi:MAG: type II secretion system protein GspL [Reinekea sp.]